MRSSKRRRGIPGNLTRDTARPAGESSRRGDLTSDTVAHRKHLPSQAVWIVVGLVILTAYVYAPVRNHEFVNWDDPQYVGDNPHVSSGFTWSGIRWALTTGHDANWFPLTWLSHMLDFQLFGADPGAHHITNVVIHALNTVLLFVLLLKMTGALPRSAFVAAFFAVHPLHVESVAWVAERKDVLSGLFWMLTLLAYVRYVERPHQLRYILTLALFACGLMAKPMLVTLPFVLLLLDIWPLGRFDPVVLSPNAPILLLEKIPFFLLAVVSSAITLAVQKNGGAMSGVYLLQQRVANALVSYLAYIVQMLWPARLAAFYPFMLYIPVWWVVGAAIILTAGTIAAIRTIRSYPYLIVGWLWFLITLVPVIGLVQVGHQSRADRYTYIPLIGLSIIIAWGTPALFDRLKLPTVMLAAASTLAILTWSAATFGQVGYWKDSLELWQHTLNVTEENWLAHYNLGVALDAQGAHEQALAHYAEAVRIKPDYADAQDNLGLALANKGMISEALEHYTAALRSKPDFTLAHYNLGVALTSAGRPEEAIAHYQETLRLDPGFVRAHYNLGVLLGSLGRRSEALLHYSAALKIDRDYAEAHNNMGVLLADEGQTDEAITHYIEALRIKPGYAEAHNNLANTLASQGKLDEAISHYSDAIRINPDYAVAHSNLGRVFAARREVAKAMHEFSEALRIQPENSAARQALDELSTTLR